MATVLERGTELTLADLAERFGPMPASRIVQDPPPGTATAADVLALHQRDKRLCELVDGVLVKKAIGYEESVIAVAIASMLTAYVRPRKLGVVAGEGGMLRLTRDLVRIPDISFVARARLPGGKVPRQPIATLAPNLAVEVLSKSNTRQEMSQKLRDYFDAGVELVWLVDPASRAVRVYTTPEKFKVVKGAQTLSGGAVLPGFKLRASDIFAVLDEL